MDDSFKRLLARAREGDTAAREAAVEAHLNLVRHLIRRFPAIGLSEDDLFQIGCVGLVKAIDRFDPAADVRFSTYAVPLILGELKAFFRDHGPVKMGRSARQLAGKARRKEAEMRARLGREPSVGEVAAALDVDAADLVAVLDAAATPASLQATVGEGPSMEESLGVETHWEESVILRNAVTGLPSLQRRLIELRYFLDRTQEETGRLLGISQVQVSRLENKALVQLREHLLPSR